MLFTFGLFHSQMNRNGIDPITSTDGVLSGKHNNGTNKQPSKYKVAGSNSLPQNCPALVNGANRISSWPLPNSEKYDNISYRPPTNAEIKNPATTKKYATPPMASTTPVRRWRWNNAKYIPNI